MTLQLTRGSGYFRGFFLAKSVIGFPPDVYLSTADEGVQGAILGLPEEIAKEFPNEQMPLGNTISNITKLPALQDDGPAGGYCGRFSNRDQGPRVGSRERRGSMISHVWGSSWGSDDQGGDDLYRCGGRSFISNNNWSRNLRTREDDWLNGSRQSNQSSSSFRSKAFVISGDSAPLHKLRKRSAY